jgi:hypothetical protein
MCRRRAGKVRKEMTERNTNKFIGSNNKINIIIMKKRSNILSNGMKSMNTVKEQQHYASTT